MVLKRQATVVGVGRAQRSARESVDEIMDMDFTHFFLWWNFVNGISDESLKEEYEFTVHLLEKYRG